MSTTTSPDWEAWQTSFMNEAFTNLRRFTSIPFLPEKMERVRKGVTPREIVYEEDRLKVYHYIGEGEPRFKTPLCFVFALVNRPYIMDLKEGRSIVANYVKAGFDTYLIDWGTPTRAEPVRAAERPGQFHRQGKDHLASRAHWTRHQRPGSKRAVAASR